VPQPTSRTVSPAESSARVQRGVVETSVHLEGQHAHQPIVSTRLVQDVTVFVSVAFNPPLLNAPKQRAGATETRDGPDYRANDGAVHTGSAPPASGSHQWELVARAEMDRNAHTESDQNQGPWRHGENGFDFADTA